MQAWMQKMRAHFDGGGKNLRKLIMLKWRVILGKPYENKDKMQNTEFNNILK